MTTIGQRLIIDTDCGIDDALALLLALKSTTTKATRQDECVLIEAITCVGGNAALDHVIANVRKILTLVGKTEIPVYAGCDAPLAREMQFAHHYHGEDGLGNVSHLYPDLVPDPISTKHAAQAILDLVNQYPHEITLIMLGPCTNFAVAYHLQPTFTSKLKQIVGMGGNIEGCGNVTPGAEFNFAVDPESAHTLVDKSQCPVTLVPWETLKKCAIPWPSYITLTSFPTAKSEFCKKICAYTEAYYKTEELVDESKYHLGDLLAVAAAILPNTVAATIERRVAVELHGTYTAGQVVQAWTNAMLPNVTRKTRFVTEFYMSLVESLVLDMVQN